MACDAPDAARGGSIPLSRGSGVAQAVKREDLMRKMLVSALCLFGVGQAQAADLPSNKAPPPPAFTSAPVVFSWTGFYAGVEGGADFMRRQGVVTNPALATTTPYRMNGVGGALGGMIGYNQQLGPMVVGVEANGDGVIGGSRTTNVRDATGAVYGVNARHNYDADLRGRLGFALDRALIFAAGGVAFGDVKTTMTGAAPTMMNANANRVGWTLGGGVEYAFTDHVIGRAEYRFTDLGTATTTNAATGVSDKVRYDSNSAMFGLMYKFGGP
ncbi:porin family protein [Rhodoblastus acidophilus]|nr:porin family protein [Rhodoblastus acidophilus]RAI17642.1 porin family protein [Rhodoblastus acidophilus]